MHSWKGFAETSLPNKQQFYSSLTMKDITLIIGMQKVFKCCNNKTLGDYHDLYVQSDTLLLADIFENFRSMSLKIYELDPAHVLSLSGLAWLNCLKKGEVRLDLLTDIDMLSMVEKGIRGGICHAIHRYANANNKYIENYNKDNE